MIKRLKRTFAVLLVCAFGEEMIGTVTVKPGKAPAVDLFSMDPYVSWSDAHVDLIRTP